MNCSFCGALQDEVDFIIQGPAVQICDQCVLMSVEILFREWRKKARQADELKELIHLMER